MSGILFVAIGAVLAAAAGFVAGEGWAKLAGLARGYSKARDDWPVLPTALFVLAAMCAGAWWLTRTGWLVWNS